MTVEKIESRNRLNSVMRHAQPTKPHSSPNTATAKSEWRSGRNLSWDCVPSVKPLPHIWPEPMAMRDCRMW